MSHKRTDNFFTTDTGSNAREKRGQRISRIIDKIRVYDQKGAPDTHKLLSQAFRWANNRYKQRGIQTVNDEFSDPLLIAEELVRYAKADSTAILASILYPSVRPITPRASIDEDIFIDITKNFGHDVSELVRNTLRLYSFDYLQLGAEATQSPEEQRKLYLLMVLWVARDRRAILIRGTQRAVNLYHAIDREKQGIETTRAEKDRLISDARFVIANMAYLAGYTDLRGNILDACAILENREQFILDRKAVQVAGRALTDDDLRDIEQQLGDYIAREVGSPFFRIEARPKRVAAAREKADRKNQGIHQLGDRVGVRIIFDANQHDGVFNDHIDYTNNPNAREVVSKSLSDLVHRAYAAWTQQFGRGNRKDDAIKAEFERLANDDPATDPDSPYKDARFDDYYRSPKPSGYKSIQDTGFIRLSRNPNGPLIEVEAQLVDEWQHKHNTDGAETAHVFFKTNMGQYYAEIAEWRAVANEIAQGRHLEPSQVYVYDPLNQIWKGLTVREVMKQLYNDAANNIAGVRIDSDNRLPRERRDPESIYSTAEKLRNGDRIHEIIWNENEAPTHSNQIVENYLTTLGL